MNFSMSKHKAGLAIGSFLMVFHAAWLCLVFLGMGQSFLDWVFSLHFIVTSFAVTPFTAMTAILLLSYSFIAGYLSGWSFAFVWNLFHDAPEPLKK